MINGLVFCKRLWRKMLGNVTHGLPAGVTALSYYHKKYCQQSWFLCLTKLGMMLPCWSVLLVTGQVHVIKKKKKKNVLN